MRVALKCWNLHVGRNVTGEAKKARDFIDEQENAADTPEAKKTAVIDSATTFIAALNAEIASLQAGIDAAPRIEKTDAAPAVPQQLPKESRDGQGQKAGLLGEAVAGEQVLPAVSKQLSVEFDGKSYPVESFEDASNKIRAAVDRGIRERAAGNKDVQVSLGNGFLPIRDASGKVIALVSENGRVWPTEKFKNGVSKSGIKALFDPFAGMSADQGAHPDNTTIDPTRSPIVAPQSDKSVSRTKNGKLEVSGFDREDVAESLKTAKIKATIAVGQDGKILVSMVGRDGNHMPMPAKQAKAIETALTGKSSKAPKARKFTGNLRNDVNIIAPGLYAEVSRGGDGEGLAGFDMSLIAEQLKAEGFMLPATETGKDSDAVIELIRQDIANGGGTLNEARTTAAMTEAEQKAHRQEVLRLADEYGVPAKDKGIWRKSEDVLADVENAIKHELGLAGSAVVEITKSGVAAGAFTSAEAKTLALGVAEAYRGDQGRDAKVRMYREIANLLQDKINERESEQNREVGRGSGEGRGTQGEAEAERPALELAGQSAEEIRAEEARIAAAREAEEAEAREAEAKARKEKAEKDKADVQNRLANQPFEFGVGAKEAKQPQRDIFSASEPTEPIGKPSQGEANGKYQGPADVASRTGQMELADRAGVIASLKLMNDAIRKIDPTEAWHDANIEESRDLNALREQISNTLMRVQNAAKPADNADIRKSLDDMSGAELKAVFDEMNLAGRMMTVTERVDALMAEDPAEVRAAIAKVANSENQPAAPVPTSQGYTSADNANTDATLARTRDRSEVRFSTPYVGTTGAKLVGYVWPNKKEEYVDNRGEDRVRTVSDWEHAVENLETGRRIVHQFFIQKPDDTEQQVSAETAATLLGISEGAVRANARKLLEREIQREKARIAAIAGADKVDAIPAADSPAAAVDGGVVFEYALNAPMIQRMQAKGKNWQDIDDRIERESASRETYRFMERDGKYIWTPEIVSEGSELSRRGWKTVELRAMEIWPGSLTPKQLEMKARAEANKTPKQKEMKARAEAAKDLVSPIPGAPVPASIEALPAGMRAIYKVDELIEKAKSAWSNRRISDELNERGTADTPEAAMRELSNLRDIVAEQDGKLRSNNRTGATPGNLLTNWLELVRSINTINKSRREEPSMWSAYDERQKVVASMNIGDRVRDPYSSIEHPLGQPATIDRKFTKNWRVKFDDGSTALYHPSTLRPLEQGGSDGNLVSDNKQGAATLKKGDRFTDGQGKTWEVWNARTSLIEAFPVIDGNIRVNNQDGQRWATDERARFANPEARTDFTPLAKEKAPVTPQTLIGNPENYIKVAADSIKELRKIDVYRVLVESNRREFRQAIAAYIKENRPDLIDEVDSVMEEARAGEASSQAAPSPAAPSEKKTEDQTGGEAAVTEDAGEELKYNKRNRIVRLKWDDIKDQDAALKVKQVVKAKVLEKPDYQAMIDGGMQPLIAHIVKQVYDGLSAKPQTRTAPSDEQLQLYINGMNRVMNGAIAWAESQDSIEWLKKMGESASVQRAAMTGGRLDLSAMAGKKTEFKRLLDYIYPEGWKEYRPELMIVGGNRAVSAMQPGLDETIKALKEIEKGWPGTREAWQVQGYSIKQIIPQLIVTNYYEDKSRDGTPYVSVRMTVADGRQSLILYSDAIHGAEKKTDAAVQDVVSEVKDGVTGKHVLFDKGNRMVGAYGSLAAAQEAAREKVKRTGGGGIKEDGISVQAARRVGKARREDGENITSAKLMETFGFRGVNFGNWMKGKSNEAERQLHLNHAYDAFLDLAEILGVPPKAMSLNGMLGLAIGAQGNGTAAAHFVPGLNEINITRTSGAGAVAHEWGHALDHYFARKAGLEREAEPFLTEHANLPAAMHRIEIVDGARKSVSGPRFGDGLRPEVLDRFREIVSAMNKRELTQEEVAQRKKNNLESAVRNVERWLESIRRDYMAPHLQGKISGAEFDAIADRIKAMDLGSGEKVKLSKWNYISPVVAELRDLYKAKTGRSYGADNIKALQSWVDSVEYGTKSAQEDEDHKPQTTSTTYAANAAKLDHDKGGKKYWSTDLEKFARAFDAFVSDQLEELAARNTYLAGLNNDIDTSPMGEERKAINAAFKALIETIETRETDAGVEFNSIEPRQTKAVDVTSPNFLKWFGDSKVVDAEGKPLVVYHGTTGDFTKFDLGATDLSPRGDSAGAGFFFTDDTMEAVGYAWTSRQQTGNVMPVYLAIKNPYRIDRDSRHTDRVFVKMTNSKADAKQVRRDLLAEGYDGILTHLGEWVAFRPEQIKSAISNTGAFDQSNPSILEDLSADQSAAISRAIDRAIAMEQGKDVAPIKQQRVRNRLAKLRADLEAEKIDEAWFIAEVERLHAQMELAYQAKQLAPHQPRARGADWIRQKLLEAKRRGDISEQAADMAEWFILKNPALVDDLGISIRERREGQASGNYTPMNRVFTLFKGEASDTTAVHEILHHLERMMPVEMQEQIRLEWIKQVTKELQKSQKAGDQKRIDYFTAVLAGDQKKATEILTGRSMGGFNSVSEQFRKVNVNSPKFLRWFGNSKVVDAEGKPLIFYHTSTGDFEAFKTQRGDLGTHFGTQIQAESRFDLKNESDPYASELRGVTHNTIPVYLSIQNPLRLPDLGSWQGDYAKRGIEGALGVKIPGSGSARSLVAAIRAAGYDGVVYLNTKEDPENPSDSYIAFEPTQIKSAISNTGEFSETNPDIRQDLDIGRDYRYLNASEFWAVSMTETVADRFKAKESIWARSLQWLREALEHIKAVLGLNSRHPLIKALNDIDKGTGEFVSKDMLGSSDLYASIEPINPVIEEVVGPVLRDISLPARLLLHPRQVAANHKEFAPVFDTAIRQYEERDSIVSKLGDLSKAYFDLGNAKKVRVGKIIEQGRLDRMTYTREDLENGIHHHGGDLIQLDDSEIAAYFSLRNAFDEALTLFRNTMLEEYGFPELVGEERAALRLAQMIAGGEIEEKRLEWAKKVAVAINEIEQAKRTGYAPFTRYGQFVVAVKALPRGVDVVEDDDLVLVRGVPESAEEGTPEARLVEIVTDLSGQFDDARGAWIVPVSRNQAVRALEKTLYATKVEVGSIKEWRSRGQDVTEIPEVKAAFDAAKAKYGNVQNSRIIAFHISEKEKARDANITAIDELAKIAAVDTETWDEVRAKLQDAIKSRGFRRHFFGSDNTPGYSTDFERSIADYIIGMSGYLARRKHVKEFDDAITRIKAPQLAAYADEYRQYINSPADEFALVKQIGFLSYIAGTVATAATNLTQVPMLTVPTLAQFVPYHVAVRETSRAWEDALAMFSPTSTGLQMFDPAKVPADVSKAFMAAWNDQLFVPLETLDLMATASVKTVGGRTTMRVLNQTTQAIAYQFMLSERINRITTFIAAQRISRMPVAKQNMQRVTAGDAWAKFSIGGRKWNERSFAEWVVDESQYRMGKVNRPKLSRGVGSPLLQFKGYMMQTLEAGYRMAAMHGPRGQASFLAAIAMMLMLGGLWGLPGLEDLRDIIEKFYKVATGKDLDLKTETRRIAAEMTGSATVGSAVAKGVPYATIGVDMSRVGMGNIIPDSPLQVFGIPADMAIGRPMRAAERAAAGNYYGAMTEMLPNFLKNPAVGLQWKFDGLRDRFGSRLMTPGEFDYGDVAIKSLGWTPTKVTNRRDYTYAESRAESGINELKRRYTNDLVRAYVREQQATTGAERKQYLEEQKAVLEAIAKHNAKASQEQMIKLDPDTLRKKAAAELLGGKAREGKERKFSRDAAQQRRELFQVP